MLNLREFKCTPDRLSDLLPWAALVTSEVVLNKDGSLQTTMRYRGPDLESATAAELMAVSARLNNVLRRLGSGWGLFVEARRVPSSHYPTSSFPEPVSFLIDEERRKNFSASSHYESLYYLTVVYLPPPDPYLRLTGKFIDSANEHGVSYEKILSGFQTEVGRLLHLMEQLLPEVEVLEGSELLTYLHSLVSDRPHGVSLPSSPMYLDSFLSDTPLLPGLEPKLGSLHLRVISILSFPGKSYPGMFDELNRLGIEYRWVTRFICLDKSDADSELQKYKKKWFAKRKGIVTLIKEVLTHAESVMTDSDAVNKALDADQALQELNADSVSFGYFTASVVLADIDATQVNDAALLVERVINALGFTTKTETINAVDAWLGTIPGNCRNNVRRPIVNTLNLSHLMPLSAVWAGPARNEHLAAPPLFYALTNGSTPFRYVTHIGDVGHTLIIGPSGSGKSVLLNLMEAQFLRYKDAQVYIFDKGGSARALTLGVGGDHYSLGGEDSDLSFQPLADIDNDLERAWAHEWVLAALQQENVAITPQVKSSVWNALSSLGTARREERTIFGLTVLLQDETLRRALLPFTLQGPHGKLLDSTTDNLNDSRFQCFEMETLMDTPSVVPAVLSCIFHKLERRFRGQPTLVVLDEAWLFLDHAAFRQKIKEWLKVLRKANVMVVFATQSLSDVDQSQIAPTIKEACFTKIYLPNPAALTEDVAGAYRRFGLNERQIELVAYATPKRDYYYTSPLGHRLFELGLGELTLSYCASGTKERQRLVTSLNDESGDALEFNISFLRHLGLEAEVRYLESLRRRKEVA